MTSKTLDTLVLSEPFTTLAVAQGLAVEWEDTSEILGLNNPRSWAHSPDSQTSTQDAG